MTTSHWTRRHVLTSGAGVLSAAIIAPTGAAFAAAPQSEGYATVPGGKIYWRKFGSGGQTPLLTLHGGPGSSHNYLLPLQALADERPVIFYDQLGCGRADAPEADSAYSIQRSVEEVDAVRSALGLDRVVLLGHSWGALLAVEYLCQGRGKGVDRLILSGAMASIPQVMAGFDRLFATMPDGWGDKIHTLEKAGKTGTPEYAELVQKFYDTFVLRVPPSPEVLATLEALSKSPAYRVLNGPNEFTIVGKIKDWDRRKDLKAITQKTLITTGEFDEVTLDCHETLRDGIAGKARLAVMTGCSHLTMNEKPAQYNALLRGFLNEA
ncbi:proline iminopeptidase-family hydrolase [Caulobacter sp. RL271]|jgi:proline iminopeptidase|uniref:Proline iminopeptidase-family hydrolase n=1 Tax=Caulobacter segnis TaxID=88688 RepID=A0ABY4ZZ63_9CAUL|nr:proline iminopeptidase-family hydrolase [Caulobacter segnis]USQ98102.1 proline iminopeptidase-family hydrolase [Caulobacter segnis]